MSAPSFEDDDASEIPLLGVGVSDGLVRQAGTVRRPRGEHCAAVEVCLQHLAAAGFDAAPSFLGIDGRGRKVLTFVEGEMGGRPANARALTEDVLVSLAGIQRGIQRGLREVSARVVRAPIA